MTVNLPGETDPDKHIARLTLQYMRVLWWWAILYQSPGDVCGAGWQEGRPRPYRNGSGCPPAPNLWPRYGRSPRSGSHQPWMPRHWCHHHPCKHKWRRYKSFTMHETGILWCIHIKLYIKIFYIIQNIFNKICYMYYIYSPLLWKNLNKIQFVLNF